MSKVKRLIKTSGIYLVGSVLSKLIAFVLLPLYTSRLSPEQFGTYDLVVTIISFIIPITFFQIWDGMYRFAFDEKDLKNKYIVISNSFLVWMIGFVIYSIVFIIISNILAFEFVWLIFLYGIAVGAQYQYTFIARAFLKNKLFVISGLINTLISAFINIILILKFNMGIESLYIAPILGCIAQILVIELTLHPITHYNSHDIRISKIKQMLKFSVPICIATISYWLLSGYTKVVISQQLGTESNGLFAVANKFSSMITLLITVFQYAWNEMAYLIAKDENRVFMYTKSVSYIFKLVTIGSSIFMLVIKIIFPYFIDPIYEGALVLLPLSLIGVAANSFAGFTGTIFLAEKQTNWIFRTTIIGAGINIVALWIFTPIWGLQGAIGALCLSFIVLACLRVYALRDIVGIKLSSQSLIYVFLLMLIVYVFYTINSILLLISIIILLTIFLIFTLRDIIIPLVMDITRGKR